MMHINGIISWTSAAATTCRTTVTWQVWNVSYTTNDPWSGWCTNAAATTGSVTANGSWAAWQRHYVRQPQPYVAPRELTPAERDAERVAAAAREQGRRAREDGLRAARLEAERKAEALLLRHLSPEQREEYQRTKSFTVKLPSGALYRINKGRAGNVELMAAELPTIVGASPNVEVVANQGFIARERLCIHPDLLVPDCDNMLAQKLMLETDEQNFRRIANITRLAGGCR